MINYRIWQSGHLEKMPAVPSGAAGLLALLEKPVIRPAKKQDCRGGCPSVSEGNGSSSSPEPASSISPLCVCAAGSGGKTSLIWALQRAGIQQKRRVLVTTTTHMMLPEAMLKDGTAAGIPVTPPLRSEDLIKCQSPGVERLDTLRSGCDLMLIEADGSRRLPLKVPASHEPVIPPWANVILVVSGLSALGHPLRQVCHRYQLLEASPEFFFPEKPGPDAPVTAALMGKLMASRYLRPLSLQHPEALILPVWNQADTPALIRAAGQAARACGYPLQLITCMKDGAS